MNEIEVKNGRNDQEGDEKYQGKQRSQHEEQYRARLRDTIELLEVPDGQKARITRKERDDLLLSMIEIDEGHLDDIEYQELTPDEEHDVEVLGHVKPASVGRKLVDQPVRQRQEEDEDQGEDGLIREQIVDDGIEHLQQVQQGDALDPVGRHTLIDLHTAILIAQIVHYDVDGSQDEEHRERLLIAGTLAIEVVAYHVARTIEEFDARTYESALEVGQAGSHLHQGGMERQAPGRGTLSAVGAIVASILMTAAETTAKGHLETG